MYRDEKERVLETARVRGVLETARVRARQSASESKREIDVANG